MTIYRFTRSAREDLIDVWLYSQETRGEAQADSYQDALHLCCERIAAGRAQVNLVPGLDRIRSHRCSTTIYFGSSWIPGC
jgi:toxin ParE1/3/4